MSQKKKLVAEDPHGVQVGPLAVGILIERLGYVDV